LLPQGFSSCRAYDEDIFEHIRERNLTPANFLAVQKSCAIVTCSYDIRRYTNNPKSRGSYKTQQVLQRVVQNGRIEDNSMAQMISPPNRLCRDQYPLPRSVHRIFSRPTRVYNMCWPCPTTAVVLTSLLKQPPKSSKCAAR